MRAVNTAVRLFAETFDPGEPIVELGSKYLPGAEELSDLRRYFPGRAYVGCDARSGLGVDRIENAEALSFADGFAGAVVMCDMLSHTPRPGRIIAEARRILSDDGVAIVSAPFNYRLNGFPTDYWRFSASGLWVLLDEAGFEDVCVFSIGPDVKPRVVVGVAAPKPSPAHAEKRRAFEERVASTYKSGRLHAHADTAAKAARDLLGTVLGRARLGVRFFDPNDAGGYWKVTDGPEAVVSEHAQRAGDD